jgi:hypothetical protein
MNRDKLKSNFTISGGYQWSSELAKLAIQYVANSVIKKYDGKSGKKIKYNINYRRLRSSAGRSMLDSISAKIQNSNVIIFDITEKNPNVMLELGYALALAESQEFLSIYLICKKGKPLPTDIPTDLHGYFISEYSVNAKNEVTFNDGGSLRMSIESDVKEYFNHFQEFNPINEEEE